FLRVVEHRLQIPRLLRTAVIPQLDDRRRRLARAVYSTGDRTTARLDRALADVRRRVRSYHEQIFYRPVLDAASSDTVLTSLTAADARDRLSAFGYRDPRAALTHIQALTSGVSRAAVIHRQVLPAMLDWLAEGVDPDAGLLAFRRLGESLRDSSWYLRLLRDSGSAVHSLAAVLSASAYATSLLQHVPNAVAWIDDDTALEPRSRDSLAREARTLVARHGAQALQPLRALHGREVLRTALADVLRQPGVAATASALSRAADVYLDALVAALRRGMDGDDVPAYEFAVIAMGRLGGAEIGYFSDADVMFAYRPLAADGGTGEPTSESASTLAAHVKRLALALTKEASRSDPLPGIVVDSD
ncbi:MAG TPA: bifunctional glutamine-synthetase adenylyltransferase/deadenyltransferase, partial [Brevibacterium sp.]|nr:bifunctional glutamine-synthetase adenylyltransferase/deadenyltransferase [Brevibacterium sp.]